MMRNSLLIAVFWGVVLTLSAGAQGLRNGDFEGAFSSYAGNPGCDEGKMIPEYWEYYTYTPDCAHHQFDCQGTGCDCGSNNPVGQMPDSQKFMKVYRMAGQPYTGIKQDVTGLNPGAQYSFKGWYAVYSVLGLNGWEHPPACAMQFGVSLTGSYGDVIWNASHVAQYDEWTDWLHNQQETWYEIPELVTPAVDGDGAISVYIRVFNAWADSCGWGAGDLRLDNFTLEQIGGEPSPTPVPPTSTPTNTPEVGTCHLGDADHNLFVNALDYRAVRDNFGEAVAPGGVGDADCQGFVNALDYRAVRDNFGNSY